ncbi:MAG: transcription-repair coupling factor, partial [Desulfomonilaceae bacterium]
SAVLMLPDAATLDRAFEELGEEVFRGRQSAAESGYPVPPPEDLYVTASAFKQRLTSFRTVAAGELEVIDPSRPSVRLSCSSNADVRRDIEHATSHDAGMKNLVHKLKRWRDDGLETLIVSNTRGQANRLLHLLQPYKLNMDFVGEGFDSRLLDWDLAPGIRLLVGGLSSGFRLEDIGLVILTEEEIFGKRVRAPKTKKLSGAFLSSFTELSEGDAVVHEDYGIGIFRGLAQKEFDGQVGEVMVIEYAGGDLLYQPLHRLHVIQKYVAASEGPPMIDRLGGKGWEKTKARIKKSIKEMAAELLDIFAKRQIAHREPYSPCFDDYAAFEASFEFEETPDQAKAIQEVMESMDSDVPMDRLVCGDVGYGKTEVALRAAFRAIMDGKQVAVLVPTTVLAQQHYETFKRRFSNYPVQVEMLSRFRAPKDQKIVLEGLKSGKVDLVVATHKLLQEHVAFKNLGLLVIDEEHRFGVAHKEKIKKYKSQIDVLTLTATPIPRTLNLSLSGIRDLSVIETPPADRKSIRTYVVRQSDEVIKEAIDRELQRGGQVFFLHNRVQSIYRRASAIKALVPHAAVAVAHGQMPNKELERVMVDFVKGKYNVLVCTSIIESGLDIPKANTIIIERADTFGLADLYQIRGRVGRSNARAYAYLLTPPEAAMTPDAIKRLAVIQDHSSLGQGFRIAMRDMEIRGAGNILGTSQSGHVSQVGYEMYLELLEEAVHELKGEPVAPRIDAEIHLRVAAQIPESYIPDPRQRMNFYRRLSKARGAQEIDEIEEEMVDLYGKEPVEVGQFTKIMHIRTLMCELRISRVDYNGRDLVLSFGEGTPIDPLCLA